MIQVKYYANLRDVTGLKEDTLNENNETVKDLINTLTVKYGPGFSKLMYDGDKLRGNIIILINGLNIIFKKGIDEKIKDGDSIDIFPPVAGG